MTVWSTIYRWLHSSLIWVWGELWGGSHACPAVSPRWPSSQPTNVLWAVTLQDHQLSLVSFSPFIPLIKLHTLICFGNLYWLMPCNVQGQNRIIFFLVPFFSRDYDLAFCFKIQLYIYNFCLFNLQNIWPPFFFVVTTIWKLYLGKLWYWNWNNWIWTFLSFNN